MKTSLFFILLVIYGLAMYAQQRDVTKFLGIPVDGTKREMRQKLKAKGFRWNMEKEPTFCDPMDCSPPRLLCPWDSPGKDIGVGCYALLQGIFPTQESKLLRIMSPAVAGKFFLPLA